MKKCKICENEVTPIEDTQMGWVFHRCDNCLFIYKDEEHIVDIDREKKQYGFHNNSLENEGYVKMLEKFIQDTIHPYKKEGECLEFGCGPGPVLATLLEQKGFKVVKYDKYFYPHKSYKQKRYDIITSTEVIEHLKDPMSYFELFRKLLKKDGILTLMTLFHPDNDEKFLKWWYRRDPTHISFYHPKTFAYICEKLDMNIEYIDDKNRVVLTNINEK